MALVSLIDINDIKHIVTVIAYDLVIPCLYYAPGHQR